MAATNTNTQNLSNLVINKVDSKQTFQQMVTNNLVNPNELYLVQSELDEGNEVFNITFELEAESNDFLNTNYTATTSVSYTDLVNAILQEYPINVNINMDNLMICNTSIVNYSAVDGICVIQSIGYYASQYIILTLRYYQNGTITFNIDPIQQSNATLTIGSYTYNGSSAVNIPV